MRRTLLTLALSTLVALPAMAQGGPGGGMRGPMGPPQSGQGIFQGITLTETQQQKVDSIWKAYEPQRNEQMEKMRAMRDAGTRPDSATRAEMMAKRQAHWGDMRTVLTPEQQKVFDKNSAEMRERMRGMGGGQGQGQGRTQPY
ncbi:MAG TPA: Spy/CpxP family protein refolding chaperone [Gemmatimonadales bacterium]|nr:Spy/CpxP family protein refolding chaperone [Gemmatimonadales bacterium]